MQRISGSLSRDAPLARSGTWSPLDGMRCQARQVLNKYLRYRVLYRVNALAPIVHHISLHFL
jgi:hypothetical protein